MRGLSPYFTLILLLLNLQEAFSKCSMTNPCADQLGAGKDFQEPVQVNSTASSWSTSLTVDIATITYNWLTLKRRVYNGNAAGPTISIKRGDRIKLDLINNLSPYRNDIGRPLNSQRHPNSTNVHTHGLHISSKSPQDDVLVHIGPKSAFQYKYTIHQHNSPGTYWYHAHLHGCTILQVAGGLSGILIVEDKLEEMSAELSAASCPENCDKDIQLLFQPLLVFKNFTGYGKLQHRMSDYEGFKNDRYIVPGGGTLTQWLQHNMNYYTTNGQLQPRLVMATGQLYRFRMVNAGVDITLELYITDSMGNPTSNCDIREIAFDGIYLSSPRKTHNGQTLLAPATRADWLVKCTSPGIYKLASFANETNDLSIGIINRFTGDLVSLEVIGKDATTPFPSTLPIYSFAKDLLKIPQEEIKERYVVEFNPRKYLNREKWKGPQNYRYKMTLGAIQEWHVLNSDSYFSHPMHMHINHYQVISYNAYTGGVGIKERGHGNLTNWYLSEVTDLSKRCYYQWEDYELEQSALNTQKSPGNKSAENEQQDALTPEDLSTRLRFLGHNIRFAEDTEGTLGYYRIGDWRDTILVPPLANITIRFVPTDFLGNVIVHCHILDHEDDGMMIIQDIVKDGESTSANIKSGNAYPGTCRKCDRYPFNNATTLCD